MKRIIFMVVILVLMVGGSLFAQYKKPKGKTYTFKLGIHYRNSPSGKRFRNGIKEAIAKYSSVNIFESYNFPYDNETEGLETLVSLVEAKDIEEKVDIILGPTDSGVFVRAIEQRKRLERSGIPVISSQVAAKIPHRKGGWFFRTNINVERRAQVIYNFLNKYWVHTIAVLYEDNEFGRRAEEAFRNELNGQQKEHYLPFSYDSSGKARIQIRNILELRPEAVGIFGARNDFAHFYELLKRLNAGSSRYRPVTFSIIDIRVVQDNLQDDDFVYFVSVTDLTKDKDNNKATEKDGDFEDVKDDVNALAFDTTMVILQELDDLTTSENFKYNDRTWRESFRNRFEAIINGNIEIRQIESKTGISFNNFENDTLPKVFELSKQDIKPVILEDPINLFEKIEHKLSLIWNRFGFWPMLNILLIILIVGFVSIKDIRRWYTGKKLLPLFKNPHFLLLVSINITIALAVYCYLGETGSIRYDSVLTALMLALAPSAILRLTLFETSTGKAIGLANYYDSFLRWVYDKLTIKNFLKNQAYINVIAYHNSVYGMKCLLKEIYQNAPNKEQRKRMQTRMEEVLKNAESWLDRRKALARLLLQKLGWDELLKRNFAPKGILKGDQVDFKKPPTDPEELINKAAKYCGHNLKKRQLIQDKINAELEQLSKQLSPERKKELEEDHNKDINEMKTPIAIMKKKISLLFLLRGYDPNFLKKICCLPESEEVLEKSVEFCANEQEKMKVLNETIKEILNEKSGEEKKKYEEIQEKYLNDLASGKASFKRKFKILFELHGCDENFLRANGLFPGDETIRKESTG